MPNFDITDRKRLAKNVVYLSASDFKFLSRFADLLTERGFPAAHLFAYLATRPGGVEDCANRLKLALYECRDLASEMSPDSCMVRRETRCRPVCARLHETKGAGDTPKKFGLVSIEPTSKAAW